MKKLTLILVVLLTVGLVGAFAEVGFDGELTHELMVPDSGASGSLSFDLNGTAEVDDYNTVNFATSAYWSNVVATATPGADPVNYLLDLNEFTVATDVTGALGVESPVMVNTTVGYFEVDPSAGHNLAGAEATAGSIAENQNGALQADFAVGPVTLHYGNDFESGYTNYLVGASGAVAGVDFSTTYKADAVDPGKGQYYIDAGYTYPVNDMTEVYVPVAFGYNLDTDYYDWNSGVEATYDMATLGVGVAGNEDVALQNLNAELSVDATEQASVFAGFYSNLDASTQALEFSGSYDLGAMTMTAGYVVDDDNTGFASYEGSQFFLETTIAY